LKTNAGKPNGMIFPQEDNAAIHLLGMEMPGVVLNATDGTTVDLRGPGLSVVYAYPRTSTPAGSALTDGTKYPELEGARLNLVLFEIISLS
jgi:peroxiredoxin